MLSRNNIRLSIVQQDGQAVVKGSHGAADFIESGIAIGEDLSLCHVVRLLFVAVHVHPDADPGVLLLAGEGAEQTAELQAQGLGAGAAEGETEAEFVVDLGNDGGGGPQQIYSRAEKARLPEPLP